MREGYEQRSGSGVKGKFSAEVAIQLKQNKNSRYMDVSLWNICFFILSETAKFLIIELVKRSFKENS